MSQNQVKSSHSDISFTKHMKICNQSYTLTHRIGKGNFGQVYLSIQSQPSRTHSKEKIPGKMAAIKIQKQNPGRSVQLPNQIDILKQLRSDPNVIGFPQLYDSGFQKGSHYMVIQLLGPSLSDLMKLCGNKFSLPTTIVLAMQIYVHSHGYVYRDIKPENFAMGIGKKSPILYMMDFGLSKRYRDPRVNLHMPYRQQQDFSGTLRYASICSHLRIQHSRRDDLQSVCYMLIYFLNGNLPWQNNGGNRNQTMDLKQRLIIQKKIKTTPAELCQNIPTQFRNILQYVLQLDYYQQPDYQMISGQLMQLYQKTVVGKQFVYDWAILSNDVNLQKDNMIIKLSKHQDMEQTSNNLNQSQKQQSKQWNSQNQTQQVLSNQNQQQDSGTQSGRSGTS